MGEATAESLLSNGQRLKERLASLVGEYSTRIGQLESDDMISVVVFGRPEHRFDFH